MKKQGWLWTEEFIWHKKTKCFSKRTIENGRIDLEILGNDYCSSIKIKNLICTKKKLWYLWEIGQKQDSKLK